MTPFRFRTIVRLDWLDSSALSILQWMNRIHLYSFSCFVGLLSQTYGCRGSILGETKLISPTIIADWLTNDIGLASERERDEKGNHFIPRQKRREREGEREREREKASLIHVRSKEVLDWWDKPYYKAADSSCTGDNIRNDIDYSKVVSMVFHPCKLKRKGGAN